MASHVQCVAVEARRIIESHPPASIVSHKKYLADAYVQVAGFYTSHLLFPVVLEPRFVCMTRIQCVGITRWKAMLTLASRLCECVQHAPRSDAGPFAAGLVARYPLVRLCVLRPCNAHVAGSKRQAFTWMRLYLVSTFVSLSLA